MSAKATGYKIRDLVIDDEYSTIDANASIVEAARKMKEKGVPDLVILEGGNQKVVGVVDDFDIVQQIVAAGKDPSKEKVKAAMYTIEPVSLDTPVESAFARMQGLKVSVVPVVEGEKLLGVATIQDCWSYIPNENTDKVGLIPVSDSRLAEFWLASICSIVAFILGVVFPLAGVFGYFTGTTTQLLDLFRMGDIRGGDVTLYLFEAHGTQFFMNYVELAGRAGAGWVLVLIFGFAMLATAIFGLFSIFYSSFAHLKNIKASHVHLRIVPLLSVAFMAAQWVVLAILLGTATPPVVLQVDAVGLTCSILAMSLTLLAIFRDHIFVQKAGGK